ncbi:MAG: PIG-L family deacetylase, partial [Raoultibacter sp.]
MLPETDVQKMRCYELVQRTNQLNLSGRRYEEQAFIEMISGEQSGRTLCITCKDRFGSYGQVGYLVLELYDRVLYVREFAMSCRVMGKCVENALSAWLSSMAKKLDFDEIVLRGVKTDRNGLVVKTFSAIGFEDKAMFEDDIALSLSSNAVVAHADAVKINDSVSQDMSQSSLQVISDSPTEVREAFVFIPHQDDEVLTCGAGIIELIRSLKGRVAVVLCTDGRNCETRAWLGDGESCPDLHDRHDYSFDKKTYGQLRDIEFIEACKALGVPESQIHFAYPRIEDGCLGTRDAEKIILDYVKWYPGSLVCTHFPIDNESEAVRIRADRLSEYALENEHFIELPGGEKTWARQHGDHYNLGRAALALLQEGRVGALELFVEFYHFEQFKERYPRVPVFEYALFGKDARKLRAAIDAYGVWLPEEERYALGLHSARKELGSLRDRPVGFISVLNKNDIENKNYRARGQDRMIGLMQAEYTRAACGNVLLQNRVDELERALADSECGASELRTSTSYRVGKAIMALPCALKDRMK